MSINVSFLSWDVMVGSKNGVFKKWPLWPWPLTNVKNAKYVHHLRHVLRLYTEFHGDRTDDKCARAGDTLWLANFSKLQKRNAFNPLAAMMFDLYYYNLQVTCVLARGISLANYIDVPLYSCEKMAINWFLTHDRCDLDLWPWSIFLTEINTYRGGVTTLKISKKSVRSLTRYSCAKTDRHTDTHTDITPCPSQYFPRNFNFWENKKKSRWVLKSLPCSFHKTLCLGFFRVLKERLK